jgi:hypothetical protein
MAPRISLHFVTFGNQRLFPAELPKSDLHPSPVHSVHSAMNMPRRSPLRRGQAMLERRLLWIREFESSHPSQPVRSLLCDFRVCENRRHSRGLGWRALVSGWQILEFRLWTGGFAAAVSARHFPISVSAYPRPVRYVTEIGLQSRFRACTAAKVERWIDCPVRGKARH